MTIAALSGRIARHWKGLLRNSRLQDELKRLTLSVLWFGVCAFCMAMVQINGDALHAKFVRPSLMSLLSVAKNNGEAEVPAVFDVAFKTFPKIPGDSIFNPDVFLHSFILVSLIAALIHWPPLTFIARLRRYFWLFGFGYFLRMCTLAGTVLPPSNPFCVPQARTIWETIAMTPALLFGRVHTCTDKLFSGHTTVATLLFWSWVDARKIAGDGKISFWRIYAFVHFVGMIITSILGWNHYTVDIVLSAIINTFTYHCYTFAVVIKQQQQKSNMVTDEIRALPSHIISIIAWCDGTDISPTMEPVENEENAAMEIV
jgi:hypothetical protein